jgi:hypothetical protein
MTDRELLERAARAVGLGVTWEPVHNCFWIAPGQGLAIRPWEPLNDDGDAFRLAVSLNYLYGQDRDICWALRPEGGDMPHDDEEKAGAQGPFAAARRAVVRAAAARLASG